MKIAVLDIGGTQIKSGLVAASAKQLDRASLLTFPEQDTEATRGGAALVEHVLDILRDLGDFDTVGISTAGQVNPLDGSIHFANPNIPEYTGTRLRERVQAEFSKPCAVENDVNAAALGELHRGVGLELAQPSFLCLTYGTGIGGAIVENGRLIRGRSGSAAEFGATITHAEKYKRTDLLAASYERHASTTALIRMAQQLDPGIVDGRMFFSVLASEPRYQKILDEWLHEILLGLSSLIHIFNPADIVLGGGIMKEKLILKHLREQLSYYIMPSFLPIGLHAARLGNKAGLWGAAYAAAAAFNRDLG